MAERACGTCKADETWCWMFVYNEDEKKCPCAHCDKNDDCEDVFGDDDAEGCAKFAAAWED